MQRRGVLRSAAMVAAGAGLASAAEKGARAENPKAAASAARLLPGSFVQTRDGTTLFYKDWGTGKPVLFVPSWALSGDMWEYQMTPLVARGLRCVTFDRRGHGRSSQPGHGYDYDTLADDLASVIELLDLRDITLVGHSMSPGEIVRYLTRHGSQRVARVVMLAPITPFLLKTADNPDGIPRQAFEAVRAALAKDRARWMAEAAGPFIGVGLPGVAVSAEVTQWVIGLCMQASLKALLDLHRTLTETDFRAELRAIKVPTLILHGDHDQSAPLALTGRRTAALIPGSRLVVYENTAHGLFLTHAERVNADLMAFINV
ncbi:alpha/beta hydrolase [Vineibacter terrae]|uniref:alpha/beta fold hydrolase n=1 Tax=Vineibacter terrae TaxID=2586908 RepID=UPI002E32709D|nr:alpha/beta hydrolase [Vineibacter terrae]HEX2888750.1 alpha/beta hydrolase [Vineibacter terrae]